MVNNDQCSGSRPALTDLKSLSHCSFLPVPLSDEVMGVQGGLMKATHTSHQPCQPLAAHQPLAHGLDGWLDMATDELFLTTHSKRDCRNIVRTCRNCSFCFGNAQARSPRTLLQDWMEKAERHANAKKSYR